MRALTLFLLMGVLVQAQESSSAPVQPKAENTAASSEKRDDNIPPEQKLLRVRRIYVESFGDDAVSKQIHAMVIASLTESKRFVVTENKERADAFLRGSGLEKTSQEFHSTSEGAAAGTAAGGHSGSVSGTVVGGTGHISGSSSGGFGARTMAAEDSSASTETINDARVAVRLVDPIGDVIWATTQESKGAKYKGASADVADKVVKQLLRDVEKIEKKNSTAATAAPPTEKKR